MFYKKINTVLLTSHTVLLNYYNTGQCIFFNTNTGLMIKKINKKYTLICISIKKNIHWPVLVLKKYIHWPLLMIKKVNKKYTLTSINDKKG